MSDASPLERAKEILTVEAVWLALGIPGEPPRRGRPARVPWREDRTPSFGVCPDGRRWRDWGRGEGGDVVDLAVRYLGVSPADAARRIIDIAPPRPRPRPEPERDTRAAEMAERERKRATWPEFEVGTPNDLGALAELRGLAVEAIEIASERGLLLFADIAEGRAWIVTDGTRRNAQARRLDGNPWQHISGSKAWTLPGSEGAWPVGLEESRPFPSVGIVEGGPDLLGFLHHAWCSDTEARVAVVAVLGASMDIPPEAVELLRRKRVRIFPHLDPSGTGFGACVRWARRLARAGCAVDAFSVEGLRRSDGAAVTDLCDLAAVGVDDWEQHRHAIDAAFDF